MTTHIRCHKWKDAEIRDLYVRRKNGEIIQSIADDLGMKRESVYHLLCLSGYCKTYNPRPVSIIQFRRRAREQKGLTLATLAKMAGINVSTVSCWELGLANPRATHRVRRVCDILGCTVDQYINAKPEDKAQ